MTINAPILVAGAGMVGLAAAAVLRAALPQHQLILLDLPLLPDQVCETASEVDSMFERFCLLAGLDCARLIADGRVAVCRSIRVQRPERPDLHLPGAGEVPHISGVALHQLWLRRLADGADMPPWSSIAATPPDRIAGYRFDSRQMQNLLRALLRHHGTEPTAASQLLVLEESPDGSCIVSIDDSAPFRPYLVVDASVGALPRTPWQDFAATLSEPGTGRHLRPFHGNRLSLGIAALRLGPSDTTALSSALADLAEAADFLNLAPAGLAEARRRIAIAHGYRLDWAMARQLRADGTLPGNAPLPPGLAHLVQEFSRRGRIPFRDADPIAPASWLALLLAAGIRPRRIDPAALAPPATGIDQLITRLSDTIQEEYL